ncbi:MAG: glycine zipper family protein [Flavobacterium sp. BFFFF1]|uniref:YMGG-like glycine zipper-containing protein n=1 Tax=Flavobacterium sp. BFFFF1 TaxID=2015557 RepID=UPI000BD2DEF2|nr:YMGG-like glycine zipper-containing protein [Flavobacterium sp. BFFFF1]OYU80689.1 MAG: glycine zipper family protein [Flavobacterium sp. BFFFF1]
MKKIAITLIAALAIMSCKNAAKEQAEMEQAKQATIDSIRMEVAKQEAEEAQQRTIDSMKAVAETQRLQQQAVAGNASSSTSTSSSTTTTTKKKGWSNTAKGAVIGAGVGAVTGAVVSKHKKGQGAIIGGAAGAILGAGVGSTIDQKKKTSGQ